ncbi:12586_t:CDS:1, partial [Funneliformis caledonium]
MTCRQNIEDSDNESNDSEEQQLEAGEEDEMILLGLSSLLDSRYLESHNYNNIVKSQVWWHLIILKYDA